MFLASTVTGGLFSLKVIESRRDGAEYRALLGLFKFQRAYFASDSFSHDGPTRSHCTALDDKQFIAGSKRVHLHLSRSWKKPRSQQLTC